MVHTGHLHTVRSDPMLVSAAGRLMRGQTRTDDDGQQTLPTLSRDRFDVDSEMRIGELPDAMPKPLGIQISADERSRASSLVIDAHDCDATAGVRETARGVCQIASGRFVLSTASRHRAAHRAPRLIFLEVQRLSFDVGGAEARIDGRERRGRLSASGITPGGSHDATTTGRLSRYFTTMKYKVLAKQGLVRSFTSEPRTHNVTAILPHRARSVR